jgi:hypothetical protein
VTTRRVRLDRISSSTRNAKLTREVLVGNEIKSRDGYVLAVRVLNDKSVYNQIENPDGRMLRLRSGDVLAGTLGTRRALRGYAGEVPESIRPGDVLHVLNLGGVLGRCTAANPDLGPPFDAEVLGAVLTFPPTGDRVGRPAHIGENAIPPAEDLGCTTRVVYVAGTCMNSGKTVAASRIIRGLCLAGLRVAGAKLTGVSLRRDTLGMVDAGATSAASFDDAGVVSTKEEDVLPTARALLNHLERTAKPDVIVAELGDGILGEYGVQRILADEGLMGLSAALVVCAPDQVGAWGACRVLAEDFGLRPTVITGPATDNEVGKSFVRNRLDLPAHNARNDTTDLVALVREAIDGGS